MCNIYVHLCPVVGGLGEGMRVHLCAKLQWGRGVAPWALVRVCCLLDRQAVVTFPVGGSSVNLGWGGVGVADEGRCIPLAPQVRVVVCLCGGRLLWAGVGTVPLLLGFSQPGGGGTVGQKVAP